MRAPLLALALLLLAAVPAQAAPRTVIFNLYPQALDQPGRVFFQANSGPFLRDLRWTGWGSEGAVGTGSWQLDCSTGGASCGTDTSITTYPARYTLTSLAPCPRFGPDARSYRRGVVEIDEPAGTRTQRFDSDYDFCAKAPTTAAATSAITSYLRKRGPAKRIRVTCGKPEGTDRECRARYTQRGRGRIKDFFVFGELKGAPTVRPFGS